MLRTLPLLCLLFPALSQAQLPFIDYGFLADDPSVLVNSVAIQPDGKILVGGAFQNYGGTDLDNLVRLNPDGSIDPTFNPGGTGPGNAVEDMVRMPDGRILICGNFLTYNGTNSYFIARLLADGTLDNTFNVQPNSINGAVWAIELHDAHKVIAGGEFFTCSGHSRPHIVRFNDNGSVDTTFVVGTGFNHNVHELLVLPDLRIVVGGQFGLYNGTPTGHIALLSPSGPIDMSMDNDPGLGSSGGTVRALARQPDGRILAGGYFQYHNGQPRSAIERLNIDGTHDMGFSSPFYPYSMVRAIAVQPDGKLVVGGEFTSPEYANMQGGPERLVRLNADGTRDLSFDIGTGLGLGSQPTAYAHAVALQPDGKIIVGGHFETVDSETQYHQLVRLFGSAANGMEELTAAGGLVAWNDGAGALWLRTDQQASSTATVELHDLTGRLLHAQPLRTGPSAQRMQAPARAGLYLVSVVDGGRRVTTRVVVE